MRFLLVLVLLSSCGQPDAIDRCNYSDFSTSGICIITNGNDLNIDLIDFVVRVTNEEFNRVLGRNDSLQSVFSDQGVSVEYVDENSDELNGNRGFASGTRIVVGYASGTDMDKCMNRYYVLGHEILHVVSSYVLNNHNGHNVPNVFMQWARNNNVSDEETVGFYMYMRVFHRCEVTH